jgi:hypothetical protein
MSYFVANQRAVSSAVEHCFHTAGVTGSIPVPPTKISNLDALRSAVRHTYGTIDAVDSPFQSRGAR